MKASSNLSVIKRPAKTPAITAESELISKLTDPKLKAHLTRDNEANPFVPEGDADSPSVPIAPPFSFADLKVFFKIEPAETPTTRRDVAAILLLAWCALDFHELASLRLEHFHVRNGRLAFRRETVDGTFVTVVPKQITVGIEKFLNERMISARSLRESVLIQMSRGSQPYFPPRALTGRSLQPMLVRRLATAHVTGKQLTWETVVRNLVFLIERKGGTRRDAQIHCGITPTSPPSSADLGPEATADLVVF